ncbi:MAG: class I SAM-dependent methyltransferase [Candidatus Thermoplasmatota archaeon]
MDKLKGLGLEGEKVLDAGTGACGMTKYLEKEGADVISIDINREYLHDCRGQTESTQFIRADLSDLNALKPEIFDYIVCNFLVSALSWNRDLILTSVFREFERLLKDHGILVIVDYYPFDEERSPAPLDKSHVELWRLENAVYELLGEGHLVEYPPDVLKDELSALDFENIEIISLLEGVPWPPDLLKEHEDLIKENIEKLESDRIRESLKKKLEEIMNSTEDRKVESGGIYELRAKK